MNWISLSSERLGVIRDDCGVPIEWTLLKIGANPICQEGRDGSVNLTAGTAEDPTPHGKIYAGKINKGWIPILPNQQGMSNIERIVQAAKSDISVTLEGINAASSDIQTVPEQTK